MWKLSCRNALWVLEGDDSCSQVFPAHAGPTRVRFAAVFVLGSLESRTWWEWESLLRCCWAEPALPSQWVTSILSVQSCCDSVLDVVTVTYSWVTSTAPAAGAFALMRCWWDVPGLALVVLLLPNAMTVSKHIFLWGNGLYFIMFFMWCVCLSEEHNVIFSLEMDVCSTPGLRWRRFPGSQTWGKRKRIALCSCSPCATASWKGLPGPPGQRWDLGRSHPRSSQ